MKTVERLPNGYRGHIIASRPGSKRDSKIPYKVRRVAPEQGWQNEVVEIWMKEWSDREPILQVPSNDFDQFIAQHGVSGLNDLLFDAWHPSFYRLRDRRFGKGKQS